MHMPNVSSKHAKPLSDEYSDPMSLQITIFDVEQGNAALLIAPTGQTALFDCGHNNETGFRPSTYLSRLFAAAGGGRLAHLVLSHPDQDHVSDIFGISQLNPQVLFRNPVLSGSRIRSDKLASSGIIETEIEEYIRLHEYYTGRIPPIDWGGVSFDYFHNSPADFTDINDLSLVSFAFYGDYGIIFPGDLSKSGWEELLYRHPRVQAFREALARVKVFVASHHGRIDGYSEDVFKFCSPAVIVFSDKGLEHGTQETQALYGKHATGIPFTLKSGKVETRYVFTTRNDGPTTITTTGPGFYLQTGS